MTAHDTEEAVSGIEVSNHSVKGRDHAHHDACSCPICQTVQRSSQCIMPAVGVALLLLLPKALANPFKAQAKAGPNPLSHGARAPPRFV